MNADLFNEAIVTAMLVAAPPEETPAKETPPEKAPPEKAPAEEDGADPPRPETVRERLMSLVTQAVNRAVREGLPQKYARTADFAVCAFLDELLLSSSWRGREQWMQNPLQLERHGTATAGEDFYHILDFLLQEADKHESASGRQPAEQDERAFLAAVLEIFALCLFQGFSGMLYDDEARIRGLLQRIGRYVPAVARKVSSLTLAPDPEPIRKKNFFPLANLIRRYDLLDYVLWLVPLAATALLYFVCRSRLDVLLQNYLGGTVPL
jgi:type VI secretion system protein ImpK